jgi:hypothetical protein
MFRSSLKENHRESAKSREISGPKPGDYELKAVAKPRSFKIGGLSQYFRAEVCSRGVGWSCRLERHSGMAPPQAADAAPER